MQVFWTTMFVLGTISHADAFQGTLHRYPLVRHGFSSQSTISVKSEKRCISMSINRRDFGTFLATSWFWAPFTLAMGAQARPEGVNKPELLPKESTPIIDLENYLTKGEEQRLRKVIEDVEKKTGYKIRVLTQKYPNTPGLAVKAYWGLDDKSILIVADKTVFTSRRSGATGNLLQFNVGKSLELSLPNQFWIRTRNKLGNQVYVDENGEDRAIADTVDCIAYCLMEAEGKSCVDVPQEVVGKLDRKRYNPFS